MRSIAEYQQILKGMFASIMIGESMSSMGEKVDYSLENAMRKLAEVLEIVSKDAQAYYLKKPEKVDVSLLKTIDLLRASSWE